MTNRQRLMAALTYQTYDRLPLVVFGYWNELIEQWVAQGHIPQRQKGEGNAYELAINKKLGFDFNYAWFFDGAYSLWPWFEREVLERRPDGTVIMRDMRGITVQIRPGQSSIPHEISHPVTDRASFEKHYAPRLQYTDDRVDLTALHAYVDACGDERPVSVMCGSLFGELRNLLGVVGMSYLLADDEELFTEIVDTLCELCYKTTERLLGTGVKFDFGHFWEDICFKNGPLIHPEIFRAKVGHHYRRITDLLSRHGVHIVSVDCDGCIDHLIPIWLENGVNTMFPIEVGTWGGSIAPWRKRYGKELRGVGGMNKAVLTQDRAAIDREIERLRPLVELGGYVPCPDHLLPPGCLWENVQYYTDRMRRVFG